MERFITLYSSFSDEEKNLETMVVGVFDTFKEANEMARKFFLVDKRELFHAQGCTATENKETGVYKLSDDYLNIHEMIEVKEIKVN